jgi:Tol biopolymer transport system component
MKFRVVHCLLLLVGGGLILPTSAHATFPGKNGRIAFILRPDVYTMNSDGSGVKQLTNLGPEAYAFWESWSPDGKQIVFNVFSPPNFVGDIWLMNADGSNQHLVLKEDKFRNERPSFTPDGQLLLFDRCNLQIEECAIFRVGLDGRGLTQLTKYELGIADLSASASPDGQSLLFAGRERDGIISALYLKAGDATLQRLTPAPLSAQEPNWSPDGTKIAFSSHCCNPQNQEIWIVNADGSGIQRLTNNGTNFFEGLDDVAPSWSPQGDAIVFERHAHDFSSSAIFVMKADGSGLAKVITAPRSAGAASIRNRMKPGGTTSTRRLKQIEEGGFFPRWGAASE